MVSDLHLSTAPRTLPDVGADLLILAGDIHRPVEAMRWAKNLPLPVIYVPGNHEHYGSSLPETDRLFGELSNGSNGSNVTVLNCAEQRTNDVRVLGATLWTDFLINGDGVDRRKTMDEAQKFTRVLANPRGYVRDGNPENAGFNPGLMVEVGIPH